MQYAKLHRSRTRFTQSQRDRLLLTSHAFPRAYHVLVRTLKSSHIPFAGLN